ncbi:MAG: 4Fe-4S binding protein [Promethearchaeota archaeon]
MPKPKEDGKYGITKQEACIKCGACFKNCPENAIIMQEQQGCGCLWDARERAKNNEIIGTINNCCGDTGNSCCNLEDPVKNSEIDKNFLESYEKFIKPYLGSSCCSLPSEKEKEI